MHKARVVMNTIDTVKQADVKVMSGRVVSDKMDKTVVVHVERTFIHPLYGKTVRSSKKYKVHDQSNAVQVGDLVEIAHCRPLSKTKYMTLVRVLSAKR